MTVVVTGAAGFIGRHLVAALAARGQTVVGIDRREAMPWDAAVQIVADLAEQGDGVVDDVLRTADAVFHLAAFPGVRDTGKRADERRQRDNVDATRRVTDAVPLATPLVVTSSSSVYGGSTGAPCTETDMLRPRGRYAESKVEAERACARRVSRGGLVAVARPFTVAGEGQRPDMAIARWIEATRRGRPLAVYGGLARQRDITDVRHVVEGLIRMAEGNVRSTVNLGTGSAVTLQQIISAVEAAVGVPATTEIVPAADVEPAATLADTTRCEQLLGFVPTTDITDLVARQAATAPTLQDVA